MAKRSKAAQAVLELYDAIRDYRLKDALALVDRQIDCSPLVRPGMPVSQYHGYAGIACLVHDMHDIHGNYQIEIDKISEVGPQVTVQARIVEPGHERSAVCVTSTYTVRNGLITAIVSQPSEP